MIGNPDPIRSVVWLDGTVFGDPDRGTEPPSQGSRRQMRGTRSNVAPGGIDVAARLRTVGLVGEFPRALLDPPEADGEAPLASG